MASHGPSGAAARDRSPRGRSRDSSARASGLSSSLSSRSVSAPRVRARSVPAPSSPTAHRPGVDLRPLASAGQTPTAQQTQYFSLGTPPQQPPTPTLPQQLPVNPGSLDDNTVNLFRQMMQAQDEQIRAQAARTPARQPAVQQRLRQLVLQVTPLVPRQWTLTREYDLEGRRTTFRLYLN